MSVANEMLLKTLLSDGVKLPDEFDEKALMFSKQLLKNGASTETEMVHILEVPYALREIVRANGKDLPLDADFSQIQKHRGKNTWFDFVVTNAILLLNTSPFMQMRIDAPEYMKNYLGITDDNFKDYLQVMPMILDIPRYLMIHDIELESLRDDLYNGNWHYEEYLYELDVDIITKIKISMIGFFLKQKDKEEE
jgi:hypothetical protein